MIVPIVAFATFLSVAKTENSLDKLELSQAREIFIWNDTDFYLYSELVSWEEANVICEAENMHLAILDNPEKTKFISKSISEGWMTYNDMWIGAHKNKYGHWIWSFENKPLPQIAEIIGNNSFWYPPWINNEIPSREGIDCLVIDRNGHNNPFFADLSCKLHRSFICEKNSKNREIQPSTVGVVSNEELEFFLYYGRLTWAEAVSFCRQQDLILASVENMAVAKKLGIAMLKSRPEVEDAWIGANLQDDQWVWIENGEELKTIPAEYKDPNGSSNPHNIITPQFPPWFGLGNSSWRNKCALIDRHLCEHPQFITMRCDRKRNFICMKRKKDDPAQNRELLNVVDRDRKRYTLYRTEATWEEAKKLCEETSDNATMLILNDIEEAKFITKIMAEARIPINHVWLGGKIINDEWNWVGRDENMVVKIPTEIDETGFPPWCDVTIDETMACLNLDRQNHWTPLIYGLECNTSQATICVETIKPADEVMNYKRSSRENDFTMLKVTNLKDTRISWMEAEHVCKKEIGKLWKPTLDGQESKKEVETLLGSFMTNESKTESELYYVEGGIYRSKANAWVYKSKKTLIETAKVPRDGDCLILRVNRTAQQFQWLPVHCHKKLKAQIICEPRCPLNEVPYEEEKSEWICDADESSIFHHKMIGMGCSHRCSEDQVLQGPDRFYCGQKRGWSYNRYPNIHINASKCIPLSNGLPLFADIPKNVTTLIFVIDSTRRNPHYYNAAKYLIANLVEYYRFQVTKITVHVVSIEPGTEDGAVVKVSDFEPTNNCEDIKQKVLLPLHDMGDGTTDYASAFVKVESILNRFNSSKSHIVLFADTGATKGKFGPIAVSLRQKSQVYAIGLNRQIPNSQLIELASIVHGVSYTMHFGRPFDVIAAVKSLISNYCSNCVCQDVFQDIATNIHSPLKSAQSTESQLSTLSTFNL